MAKLGPSTVYGSLNVTGPLKAQEVDANAKTASKLLDARTISLGGDASGSASFDGSANITITADVCDSQKLGGRSKSTSPTANTIAERDASGDVCVRLVKSTYAATTSAPASGVHFAFRCNDSNDSFVRFATLDAYTKVLCTCLVHKGCVLNSVTSTSTTAVAAADAVKCAYDRAGAGCSCAQAAVKKAGDTMTGNLLINRGASCTPAALAICSSSKMACFGHNNTSWFHMCTNSTNGFYMYNRLDAANISSRGWVCGASVYCNGQLVLSRSCVLNSVTSTSTTAVAAADAVKCAYDRGSTACSCAINCGNAALKKSGGTMTGTITMNDNVYFRIGSGADVEHFWNGSNYYTDINGGAIWYVRDGNSSNANRYCFDVDNGHLRLTGKVCADGGLVQDGHTIFNGSDTWMRTSGNTGWYSATHGGGMYMTDTTWVRVYSSKAFCVANQIAATSNITAYYSDERLKDVKEEIDAKCALASVKRWKKVRYTANELGGRLGGWDTNKVEVGLLAGEVQKDYPELTPLAPFDYKTLEDGTIVSESGENYKTLDYERVVAVQAAAITELSDQVDELKRRLDLLTKE